MDSFRLPKRPERDNIDLSILSPRMMLEFSDDDVMMEPDFPSIQPPPVRLSKLCERDNADLSSLSPCMELSSGRLEHDDAEFYPLPAGITKFSGKAPGSNDDFMMQIDSHCTLINK